MKKTISAILCLLVVMGLALGSYAETRSAETAKSSVVRFFVADTYYYATDSQGNVGLWDSKDDVPSDIRSSGALRSDEQLWTGSGFAVGEKNKPIEYIVTNKHVVEAFLADGRAADNVYIVLDFIDRKIPVDVVKMNSDCDLAIVHLSTPITDRTAAVLRPFDSKSLGAETVYTLGFPGLADDVIANSQLPSTVDKVSVRSGVISRVLHAAESTTNAETIQMDAQINGGNSGGPLVDKNGYVLGINTFSVGDEAKESSIYGAISVNELIPMLDSLRIPYMTNSEGSGGLVLVIIAVLVLAAAAVLIWLLGKKKGWLGKKKDTKNRKNQPIISVRHMVGKDGVYAGKSIVLDQKHSKYVIGRDGNKCQITYSKDTLNVSAVHCTVKFSESGVTVTDEGSSAGTLIDGKRIPPHKPVVWHRGHVLSIGSAMQTFVLRD